MERCLVPSDVLPRQHPAVAAFGEVAELFIKKDYCVAKGGCDEFLTPNSNQTDF